MIFEGESAWIEEHPASTGEPQKVLNGHITGCFGLQDIWEITLDEEFRVLVEKCENATRETLPKFDAGWTSYYALYAVNGPMAAEHGGYNKIHVGQLRVLYEMTGDELFKKWADRFASYENAGYTYRADIVELPQWPVETLSGDMAKGFARTKMPATVVVETTQPAKYKGFAIETGATDRMPKKAILSALVDDEWVEVAELNSADTKSVRLSFEPVETTEFRLEMTEPGSAGFIHLKAAVPILDLPPV